MATTAQRQHVAHTIDWLLAHAAQLLYPPLDHRTGQDAYDWTLSEGQAEKLLAHPAGRLMFDCSELGAWVLRCAGLWPWSDPGYTGSTLDRLPSHYTDPKIALVGAVVIFGPGTGDHECLVYKPDPVNGNPLVAGHGRPGFDIGRLSAVAAGHRPPVRFCSIAHL